MVAIKGGGARGEDVGKSLSTNEWGAPVRLTLTLLKSESVTECDWPDTTENARRRVFCSKYEGYGSLCHCSAPLPLTIKPLPLTPNNVADVPVAVIASNRPLYLFRMLQKLLSVAGADPAMVTVFIDGYFQEPMDVTELLGVKSVQVRGQRLGVRSGLESKVKSFSERVNSTAHLYCSMSQRVRKMAAYLNTTSSVSQRYLTCTRSALHQLYVLSTPVHS